MTYGPDAGPESVIFDEEKHEYRNDAGRIFPAVTEILKAEGFIDTRFYSEEGRDRGTAVHKMIAAFLRGGIPAENPAEYLGYLDAVNELLKDYPMEDIVAEDPLRFTDWGYAGTPDVRAKKGAKKILLDFKTGGPEPWHPLQTAAYAMLARHGEKDLRFGCYIKDTGKYSLIEHKDPMDFTVWRAAVTIYRYKRRNPF